METHRYERNVLHRENAKKYMNWGKLLGLQGSHGISVNQK